MSEESSSDTIRLDIVRISFRNTFFPDLPAAKAQTRVIITYYMPSLLSQGILDVSYLHVCAVRYLFLCLAVLPVMVEVNVNEMRLSAVRTGREIDMHPASDVFVIPSRSPHPIWSPPLYSLSALLAGLFPRRLLIVWLN